MKTWEWVAIAVVLYLLVLRKPSTHAGAGAGATPAGRTTSAPDGFFNAAGAALGSFFKTFGGGSSSASPSASGSFSTGDGLLAPDFASTPDVPSSFDTNNFSTSSGFMFTDDSGDFVAG